MSLPDVQSDGGNRGNLSIDLTRPGDVALIHRAVVNNWPVPAHVREQIVNQLDAAFEAAEADPNPRHRVNRILKLVKLLHCMSVNNMIALGHGPSSFPYLRKRYPEHRKPRRRA